MVSVPDPACAVAAQGQTGESKPDLRRLIHLDCVRGRRLRYHVVHCGCRLLLKPRVRLVSRSASAPFGGRVLIHGCSTRGVASQSRSCNSGLAVEVQCSEVFGPQQHLDSKRAPPLRQFKVFRMNRVLWFTWTSVWSTDFILRIKSCRRFTGATWPYGGLSLYYQ